MPDGRAGAGMDREEFVAQLHRGLGLANNHCPREVSGGQQLLHHLSAYGANDVGNYVLLQSNAL